MKRFICILCCVLLMVFTVGCAVQAVGEPALRTVLIDPGHGGFDGGTVAEDGTTEKHINLSVGLVLRDMLTVCGVPVDMTRDGDTSIQDPSAVTIHEKKVSDMRRRLSLYNSAALVISIHQNHFSVPKYDGTQVFYSRNHPDSHRLAAAVRAAVIRYLQPQNTRELKQATDGIYLLHHTTSPAILVECGFLSNPEEREQLKDPDYQQKMAWSILLGYWNYTIQE